MRSQAEFFDTLETVVSELEHQKSLLSQLSIDLDAFETQRVSLEFTPYLRRVSQNLYNFYENLEEIVQRLEDFE